MAQLILPVPVLQRQVHQENAHLVEVFKAELADAMDDTLEYSGLSMEGKLIVFETLGVEVGSDAVATRLDFVVVDAP